MARSVFAHPSPSAEDLKRAAEAWHDAQGQPAVPKIAALTIARPEHDHSGKVRLASFLHRAGDSDTALALATALLGDETADPDAVFGAAKVLMDDRWCRCRRRPREAGGSTHMSLLAYAVCVVSVGGDDENGRWLWWSRRCRGFMGCAELIVGR